MVRIIFSIALCVLVVRIASGAANAHDLTCTRSQNADLPSVLKSPRTFLGQCLRLRGFALAVPKAGMTFSLTPAGPSENNPGYIVLYFNKNVPEGPQTKANYAEIAGRVLMCDKISENAMESADRANREESVRPRAPGEIEIVNLGMVFGICHYKSDAFAILVSRYKTLPMPSPN
jgi:hypothetical protein